MQWQLEYPQALWGFVPLAILLGLMLYQGMRMPASFSRRRVILAALAFSFCIVGLARPQVGTRLTRKEGFRANLFIAVDISRSMLVKDVIPSRLDFATAFATKVVQNLPGARTAIFPFALDGFILTPLTSDTNITEEMLGALSTTMTTSQGTDLSRSLETLLQIIGRMETAAEDRGEDWAPTQVLLLSDGESQMPERTEVLRNFRSRRIPVFTVGVGTAMGGPVPDDVRFGQPRNFTNASPAVRPISRAQMAPLERISHLTGGEFFPAKLEESRRAADKLTRAMQFGKLSSSFKVDREYFPLLLIIAVCLFSLELAFGRWEYALRAAWIPLLFMLAASPPARAENDIPEATPVPITDEDRRAVDAYNEGLGFLKSGNAQKAVERFQESASMGKDNAVRKKALFALGNGLLRMGDPTQAIQVYQQAHDTASGDEALDKDANRRISENLVLAFKKEEEMKQQQQQKQKEGEGEGESKDPQQSPDPKGPQKNFQGQYFTDEQRRRIYDLIASEEQQILQRLMEQRNRKQGSPQSTDKPW